MNKKVAFITGITGQDGSYLAELLLAKGYQVHGLKRRASSLNTSRIDHIYQDPHQQDLPLFLHYGDMTDSLALCSLLQKIQPDEIYHLAAQSHVAVSFEAAEYTANVVALGTIRLLEAVRLAGLTCRFFQAATSEMYGNVTSLVQNEDTPFRPCSPYAIAKVGAYWTTVNYREAYGLFAVNGIMFNHESPRRGETFVTRKITRGLAAIALGQQQCLYLGNLDARRDWGFAADYMDAAWRMLQQDTPNDYVIATGVQHTVREFLQSCAASLGISLSFSGSGLTEVATVLSCDPTRTPGLKPGDVILRIDPRYLRPSEVPSLCGDATRARTALDWRPATDFAALCQMMMAHDLELARRQALLEANGYAR
ncbi:GDP-mannose 4,6-dehydratase [Rheinheimera texasensis]|uniref:GDP-mannose 4,6-dehydratase n=1 Tax=Rheinheimera texasensis TaxID=306205 RepID=UPI0032B179A0